MNENVEERRGNWGFRKRKEMGKVMAVAWRAD